MLPHPSHPRSSQLPRTLTVYRVSDDPYTPSMYPSVASRACFSQSQPERLVTNTTPGCWPRMDRLASLIDGRASGRRAVIDSSRSSAPDRMNSTRNGSLPADLGTNR